MECDVLLVHTIILKVGVGMSMEGIEQNPIVYDLMSEMAFHHEQVDLQVK
jgi:alpha-N-acetylglucosaminidase